MLVYQVKFCRRGKNDLHSSEKTFPRLYIEIILNQRIDPSYFKVKY